MSPTPGSREVDVIALDTRFRAAIAGGGSPVARAIAWPASRFSHGSPSGLGPLRPAQHRHVRHPVAVPPQARANTRTSINTITSGIDDNNNFDISENFNMIQLRDTFRFGINDTSSFDINVTFRNNANAKAQS